MSKRTTQQRGQKQKSGQHRDAGGSAAMTLLDREQRRRRNRNRGPKRRATDRGELLPLLPLLPLLSLLSDAGDG